MFRFSNVRSTLNLIRAMALQPSIESSRIFRRPMPKGALRPQPCPRHIHREWQKRGGRKVGRIAKKPCAIDIGGFPRRWEVVGRFGRLRFTSVCSSSVSITARDRWTAGRSVPGGGGEAGGGKAAASVNARGG
jgi:hypothetical protein